MIWVFGLLLILDAWTTVQAIKLGGGEGNKFVKWCMDRVGVIPALVILSVAIFALVYVGSKDVPFLAVAATIWRGSVVYHNFKAIKVLRGNQRNP